MITSSQVWVLSRCLGLQQTEDCSAAETDPSSGVWWPDPWHQGRRIRIYSVPHSAQHSSLVHNIASFTAEKLDPMKLPSDVDSNLLLKLNWYFYCCLRFIDDNYAFQVIVWSIICHYHERVKSLGSTIEISFLVKLAHFNYFGWEGKLIWHNKNICKKKIMIIFDYFKI